MEAYLKDASHFQGQAEKVLLPSAEAEVCQILRKAQAEKISITVAGAGTGLTGGRVPQGGQVLSTERMNRILSIEWNETRNDGWVRLQPGVSLKELDAALEAQGLFYPPDPGEKAAFLGGTLSTNASGPRSFKYGPTRRYVRRLRLALPTGEILDVRRGQVRAEGGVLSIYLEARSLRVPVPTYASPRTRKNVAGYFAAPDMDLIDLFIGAEGTLGVITEAELTVLKKPESVLSGVLFFDSEQDCFAFAERLWGRARTALSPRVLEFFDRNSLAILAVRHEDIPERAGAALLFEQECRASEQEGLLREWTERAQALKARASDCWFSHQPEDLKTFRAYRYDLPVLVNEQVARSGFRKLGTDLAVPEERARAMFDFYLDQLPKSGIDYAIWGHLGDHHLHVNLLPKTAEQFERSRELYGTLAKQAVEWGGTVSAEHGIGKARVPYLEWMVGREGLRQMARVKKALDPNGILNPGNIFPVELLHSAHGEPVEP